MGKKRPNIKEWLPPALIISFVSSAILAPLTCEGMSIIGIGDIRYWFAHLISFIFLMSISLPLSYFDVKRDKR
jgi:hypothetical protein